MSPGNFINGVGVILRKGDKILIGRRLNAYGEGTFAVPGGRLDFGETFLATAARELYEETGIDVRNSVPPEQRRVPCYPSLPEGVVTPYEVDETRPKVNIFEAGSTCAISPADKLHMVVRIIVCDAPEDAEPQVTEPHKCDGWYWVPWTEIQKMAAYQYEKIQMSLKSGVPRPMTDTSFGDCPEYPDIKPDVSEYTPYIPELRNAVLFQPLLIIASSNFNPFPSKDSEIAVPTIN